MFEASFYTKSEDRSVDCFLCRHRCHIKEGKSGLCIVRENKGGTLYSIFYGRPCAMAVDPIEKKPLFHFHPASRSFSIATLGCNFQCEFCQNWDISQYGRKDGAPRDTCSSEIVPPAEIVRSAQEQGCRSISYTYSEPTIFYEYARDIANIAKPLGIDNIFVTNGYMTREMLDDAKDFISAANVDLKSFKDSVYKKVMKGSLDGVLDSISYMHELGIWIEVTTLIVPGMNDSESELKEIAGFIAGVDRSIPWHISRFYPQFKMHDKQATPEATMELAFAAGKDAGLKYIYMGNVPGAGGEDTLCWKCGECLIERTGFYVKKNLLTGKNSCPKCNSKIDGVF